MGELYGVHIWDGCRGHDTQAEFHERNWCSIQKLMGRRKFTDIKAAHWSHKPTLSFIWWPSRTFLLRFSQCKVFFLSLSDYNGHVTDKIETFGLNNKYVTFVLVIIKQRSRTVREIKLIFLHISFHILQRDLRKWSSGKGTMTRKRELTSGDIYGLLPTTSQYTAQSLSTFAHTTRPTAFTICGIENKPLQVPFVLSTHSWYKQTGTEEICFTKSKGHALRMESLKE
jgi:hypothetical protein